MLGKVSRNFIQTIDYTVRYLRSSTSERNRRTNLIKTQLTGESSELNSLSNQSIESFESCKSTIESTKMSRSHSKFNQLCREFEVRLENTIKISKERILIENSDLNKTIIIDDDIEDEFNKLIRNENQKKNDKKINKTDKKSEQAKLTNITSKVHNVQQNVISPVKSNQCLKETTINNVDLNIVQSKPIVDIKKTLKPDNYRIQQAIKVEDLVYFDLETGGMGSKEDILQIGAVNYEGKQFNMYATPTRPIPGMSSRIHHITFKDNQMYYRKNPVKHHSIIEVLLSFCEFLNQTKSNNIVLVAHNANFDRRFLIEKMFLYNMQSRLNAKVIGFLDTLPMFRQLIPGQLKYKQDALVYTYFPQTKTDFHNALNDVIYLRKLFEKVAIKRMKSEFKFINSFTQSLEYGFLKKEQQMFEELSKKKVVVSKSKKGENKPKKRKSSSIYIDGEPVKRTRKSKAEAVTPSRRSNRLNKN